MKENRSFEDAMKRLQEIVQKLEDGETGLDESIKLFEEGAALSSVCYEKLQKAEQKITELSKIDVKVETADEH